MSETKIVERRERKSLIERVRDAGQAIVAISAVAGLAGALLMKAWGWAAAGPQAKRQVANVEARVSRIERQMRFVVLAAEKTNRMAYKDWERERLRRHQAAEDEAVE